MLFHHLMWLPVPFFLSVSLQENMVLGDHVTSFLSVSLRENMALRDQGPIWARCPEEQLPGGPCTVKAYESQISGESVHYSREYTKTHAMLRQYTVTITASWQWLLWLMQWHPTHFVCLEGQTGAFKMTNDSVGLDQSKGNCITDMWLWLLHMEKKYGWEKLPEHSISRLEILVIFSSNRDASAHRKHSSKSQLPDENIQLTTLAQSRLWMQQKFSKQNHL